jgi:hypothetical protein
VADLFQTMGVPAPRKKAPEDPAVRRYTETPRDRSVLFPPEVQQVPSVLGAAGPLSRPPGEVSFRIVDRALALSFLPDFDKIKGFAPFRMKVAAMGRALREGLVTDRGRTIVVDRNGLVLDGLVLLKAIADTGIPLACHWVTGIDRFAIAVMDRHLPRHGGGLDLGGIEVAGMAVAATALVGLSPDDEVLRRANRSTAAWITLTKPMADAWLHALDEKGIQWRRVSKSDELYKDVAANHFVPTGQPMVVGSDGVPLDGARRAHAVSLSGVPITVLVVYGVDPRTPWEAFDCTPRQNLGFHLNRLGHYEGWDAQGSLTVLKRILENRERPTQYELCALYLGWPDYEDAVRMSYPHQKHLAQSVHVAVRAVISLHRGPDVAEAFLSRLLPYDKDPARVAAFRKEKLEGMDEREAAVARRVWKRLGLGISSPGGIEEKVELVDLFLEAFLRMSGERVVRKAAPNKGTRYPNLAPRHPA